MFEDHDDEEKGDVSLTDLEVELIALACQMAAALITQQRTLFAIRSATDEESTRQYNALDLADCRLRQLAEDMSLELAARAGESVEDKS